MSIFATIRKRLGSSRSSSDKDMSESLCARIAAMQKQLAAIENRMDLQEAFSHGSRATFVGNNRVLTKIVVANNQIALFVEADDRLLSPWFIASGQYETPLTNYFVSSLQPGSHCLDIGANFGYFTCLMARFCPNGRVVGVEADRHVYEIARDNVFINGFGGFAEVIHAAAGDSASDMTLYRRNTRSGNTSIIRFPDEFTAQLAETPSQAFEVKGLRIDDLLPRMEGRVDFIKVDVEGAEPLVFDGARATIAANPNLAIVVEWSPDQIVAAGFDVSAFLASLKAMDLQPYDLDLQGSPTPVTFEELLNLPYRAGILLRNRKRPAA